MKIGLFLFSQHGIGAMEQIRIFRFRVRVLSRSQFRQPISRYVAVGSHIHRQNLLPPKPHLWPMTPPSGSSTPNLPVKRDPDMKQGATRLFFNQRLPPHVDTRPTFRQHCSPTWVVPPRRASLAPWFPYPKPTTALFLSFVSNNCAFLDFLDFFDTQRHLQDFRSCFAPSSSCVSSFKSLIVVVSLFFGFYGCSKFNIFSHFGCICYFYNGEISYVPSLHSSIQTYTCCICCPDR